jgi:hypothetical protein
MHYAIPETETVRKKSVTKFAEAGIAIKIGGKTMTKLGAGDPGRVFAIEEDRVPEIKRKEDGDAVEDEPEMGDDSLKDCSSHPRVNHFHAVSAKFELDSSALGALFP